MPSYFYYFPCPLCQQDVDISQPDFYRVLPLDCDKMAAFNEKPACDRYKAISAGDLQVDWGQGFPYLGYMERVWLLHTRCLSLVDLPLSKLYLLLDLVESTIESCSNPPASQHGAFYTQPVFEEYPAVSVPDVSCAEQFTRNLWAAVCALLRCIIPPKKPQAVERPSLPAEIWNRILQYDVGHMCFIMRAASQLSRLDTVQRSIPNLRFKVEVLDFSSSLVQIHTINIGGRAYISHLSNSSNNNNNHATQVTSIRCYDLTGSNYLAVKGDGIGIVDIAFEQQDGQPNWIFGNPTQPFSMELCEIKDANLQSLRIIRDVCSHYPNHDIGQRITASIGPQMPSYYHV